MKHPIHRGLFFLFVFFSLLCCQTKKQNLHSEHLENKLSDTTLTQKPLDLRNIKAILILKDKDTGLELTDELDPKTQTYIIGGTAIALGVILGAIAWKGFNKPSHLQSEGLKPTQRETPLPSRTSSTKTLDPDTPASPGAESNSPPSQLPSPPPPTQPIYTATTTNELLDGAEKALPPSSRPAPAPADTPPPAVLAIVPTSQTVPLEAAARKAGFAVNSTKVPEHPETSVTTLSLSTTPAKIEAAELEHLGQLPGILRNREIIPSVQYSASGKLNLIDMDLIDGDILLISNSIGGGKALWRDGFLVKENFNLPLGNVPGANPGERVQQYSIVGSGTEGEKIVLRSKDGKLVTTISPMLKTEVQTPDDYHPYKVTVDTIAPKSL